MSPDEENKFWSEAIGISRTQFNKSYVKATRFSAFNYRPGFGHGTCNVYIGNAILAKKVKMGLRVLEDYFSGA
jgi:hypothetical protein